MKTTPDPFSAFEVETVDPDGVGALGTLVTVYVYNAAGMLASVTTPVGTTTYAYDNRRRRTSATQADPDGAGPLNAPVSSTTYDDAGNVLTATDALGNVTSYDYDALNRVIEITSPDPDGAGALTSPVTSYEYDEFGQLVSMTDPNGGVTTYVYDDLGRKIKEILPDPDGEDSSIDLSEYTLGSYDSSQAGTGTATIEDDGATLVLEGNIWRDIAFSYTVTADTILEFDFESGSEGEIHGIGFDTDLSISQNRTFQLYGTQTWGVGTFGDDYDPGASTVKHYQIRVGDYFTGSFNYLVFVNDKDAGTPDAESIFSNIRVYEEGATVTADSPEIEYAYDANGQLVSMTDELGNETTYEYDNLARRITVTLPDPDGAGAATSPVTTYEYDAAGQLSSVTDPLGRKTSYTYDDMGRTIVETLPDPDEAGPLTVPYTSYTYGSDGRLASVTDTAGQTVSYTYTTAGQVATMTDPRGVTTYTYDALGRQLTVTEPDPDDAGPLLAPVTTYAYNDDGQLESMSTNEGTTSYEYDDLGRIVKVTMPDPDGGGSLLAAWTVYEYDALGRTLSETDRLGHETSYDYDNLGRLIKKTDAEGGETEYTYDANGNRLTLTDPEENTTTWTYDLLNRMLTNTNELSDTRYYEYDAAGNLVEYTDRNGRVIEYEYDNLQRRIAENWLAGMSTVHFITYVYDAASQLIEASDSVATYTFTYDNLGRNTSTEHDLAALGFDVVIDEAYDALNRRTSLSAEIDGTDDLENTYAYDYLNRMTQVTQGSQSGGNAVAEKRVDFTYDAEDKYQFTSITRYADLAGTETVATSSYGYDSANQLTSLTHVDGGSSTLAGYTYSYDEGNRLTGFTVYGYSAEDAAFSYDDTDQLTGADRSGTSDDESYTYDENGNRTGGGYSTGDNNQVLSNGTHNYTYDDEGNRLTKTNISTGEVIEYSWDYRNRLISIITKDSLAVVTHEVEYTYDAFNRRIVKSIDADGAGVGTAAEEIYVYDGLREERSNAGDHILLAFDESGDLTGRFMYGPNVDQVLASEEIASTSSAGDVLWALTDNLGTVRDLAEYDAGTNTTTIVNHLAFNAFGQITSETNSAVDFLFAFTARERDEESSLQYSRERYLESGRWISEDPLGFGGGDENLTRYVRGGVTLYSDPSGLQGPYQLAPGYGKPDWDPVSTNPIIPSPPTGHSAETLIKAILTRSKKLPYPDNDPNFKLDRTWVKIEDGQETTWKRLEFHMRSNVTSSTYNCETGEYRTDFSIDITTNHSGYRYNYSVWRKHSDKFIAIQEALFRARYIRDSLANLGTDFEYSSVNVDIVSKLISLIPTDGLKAGKAIDMIPTLTSLVGSLQTRSAIKINSLKDSTNKIVGELAQAESIMRPEQIFDTDRREYGGRVVNSPESLLMRLPATEVWHLNTKACNADDPFFIPGHRLPAPYFPPFQSYPPRHEQNPTWKIDEIAE